MKRVICSIAILAIIDVALPYSAHAQNVGINTTGTTPSTNAILDLNTGNSGNMGLILPHAELGSSATTFGLAHSATTKDTGMVIYNMNSRYYPLGLYYWDGASTGWVSVTPVSGANDGLNLNGTNVQLGGTLLGNTSIASAGYNLAFTGTGNFQLGAASSSTGELDFFNSSSSKSVGISAGNTTTSYTLTLPTSTASANGQVLSSTTAGVLSWTTPSSVTAADNGLTISGADVQLGGTLLGNTSIASAGYNLAFTGTGNFQLGAASSSTGELDFFNSSSSKSVGISAGNTTTSYTLTLPTSIASANGQVLSSTTAGVLSWITPSATMVADNGLTVSGGDVQLGGANALLANTSIISGGYNLAFTGTGNFQLGAASSSTGELDFLNSSSANLVGISAGNTTTSYTLTLPTSAPSANGQVLTSTTAGVLSWTSGSSGWSLTGNSGTSPGTNFLGTTDGEALEFKTDGQESGWLDYTSPYNTFLGYQSGSAITSGYDNAVMGYQAGSAIISGYGNTALGYQALNANQYDDSNTAIGYRALYSTKGNSTIGIGYQALYDNAYGIDNIGIGANVMYTESSGSFNVAIGYNALYNNPSGTYNIAEGYKAEYNNSSNGNNNIALGTMSLYNATSPANDIALGYQSLYDNYGSYCIALGYQALYGTSSQYASYSIALGYRSLYSVTFGTPNIAVGDSALYKTSSGNNNVAVGNKALYANTSGTNNTAIGYNALYNNAASYSTYNTATGSYALYGANGMSGTYNTANGALSLYGNTSGSYNAAMGYDALYTNTTGSHNSANGYQALYSNTTGSYNTAMSEYSLYDNTTGIYNTAIGQQALKFNSTGSCNTALGHYAGYYNTGTGNTYIGDSSGMNNSSGIQNTFIGYQAGNNASLTTYNNVVCVGYNSGAGSTAASNAIYLGNASTAKIYATPTSLSTYSDRRVKNNIQENVAGLAFIMRLRPVTYNLNLHKENELLGIKDSKDFPGKYDIERITQSGFIAQEVDSAAQACGYDFAGVERPKTKDGLYTLGYATFVVPLVKAVQEQQQMIDTQKKTIDEQKTSMDELKQKMEAMQKQIDVLLSNQKQATAVQK